MEMQKKSVRHMGHGKKDVAYVKLKYRKKEKNLA